MIVLTPVLRLIKKGIRGGVDGWDGYRWVDRWMGWMDRWVGWIGGIGAVLYLCVEPLAM